MVLRPGVMGGETASKAGVVRAGRAVNIRIRNNNFTQQSTENLASVGLEKNRNSEP